MLQITVIFNVLEKDMLKKGVFFLRRVLKILSRKLIT